VVRRVLLQICQDRTNVTGLELRYAMNPGRAFALAAASIDLTGQPWTDPAFEVASVKPINPEILRSRAH
jgi:hypothetical protein